MNLNPFSKGVGNSRERLDRLEQIVGIQSQMIRTYDTYFMVLKDFFVKWALATGEVVKPVPDKQDSDKKPEPAETLKPSESNEKEGK